MKIRDFYPNLKLHINNLVRKSMEYIEHKILKQKKLDLSCWGEWFDSEYVERHFCHEKEHREHLAVLTGSYQTVSMMS